jgi:hypothetical protein
VCVSVCVSLCVSVCVSVFLCVCVCVCVLMVQHESSERARAGGARRPDDGNEFKVGRLKHDRVFVPRGEQVCASTTFFFLLTWQSCWIGP